MLGASKEATMKYVVALKREARGQLKESLCQFLAKIPGAGNIVGDDDAVRVQVDLTPEAVAQLEKLGADLMYIEPLVAHKAFSSVS